MKKAMAVTCVAVAGIAASASSPPSSSPSTAVWAMMPRGGSSSDATNSNNQRSDDNKKKKKKKLDPMIQELIDEDDYYSILGVSRSATEAQIKKAYRRRAVQTHPDKLPDGDRRAFDKVAEAYDVLSDENKRRLYNQFGKRGLQQQDGPSSFEDMFRSFFGPGGGGPFGSGGVPRNRSVRYQLEVTLEDLYKGMSRTILVEQPGKGPKRVEVNVPAGMASGEKVVLSGEMDVIPDATPGDLVFVVTQRPHPTFVRKGHDLAVELTISLHEAICGVTRKIRHLDGRPLVVSSARNEEGVPVVIQTGDVHVLERQGMPKRHRPGTHGDLYVQYRVRMPAASAIQNLQHEEREQLGSLLGKLEGTTTSSSEPSKEADIMKKALATDFGRTPLVPDEESDDETQFGSTARHFFWSGGDRNPFYGGSNNDDGSNVQCQQM